MPGQADHYEPRTYRDRLAAEDLVSFNVRYRETDLWIAAEQDLKAEAFPALVAIRRDLETYISREPAFLTSLAPVTVSPDASPVVKEMADMSGRAGVGPMAAVAGAVAQAVGTVLLQSTRQVIVENGGDIFMAGQRPRTVAVLVPPDSPYNNKISLRLKPTASGVGLCTSSGTVGHSLSRGKADAVVVQAGSCALADAAATAIGNRVTTSNDIAPALEYGQHIKGLTGILIIIIDQMGAWGEIEIVE